MDRYVTGAVIRRLRESKKMTQEELAARIFVSAKAVSKWETGQGFPDISLIEPLAEALGISVIELLSGEDIRNQNRSSNMARAKFYICPVCGNIIHATGQAVISCCGITLPPAIPENIAEQPGRDFSGTCSDHSNNQPDSDHNITFNDHNISVRIIENEYYVTLDHPMTKDHHISFIAAASDHSLQLVKLYPEGQAQAYFRIDRVKYIYAYCNHHGLYMTKP